MKAKKKIESKKFKIEETALFHRMYATYGDIADRIAELETKVEQIEGEARAQARVIVKLKNKK